MTMKGFDPFSDEFEGFDFQEIDAVEEKAANAESYKKRLHTMYNMINTLLRNLEKSPEKDTIKWPNRAEQIEEFRSKLKVYLDD